MKLPDDLSPERKEWIRHAGDNGRKLYVGSMWDFHTVPPKLILGVALTESGRLSPSEIERIQYRLTAPLPEN